MPVREATPEEPRKLFGGGLIVFGANRPPKSAPPSKQEGDVRDQEETRAARQKPEPEEE